MALIPGFASSGPAHLRPVIQDSKGLGWDAEVIKTAVAHEMVTGNHFERRVKENMTPDFDKATEVCDSASVLFGRSMDRMLLAETRMGEVAKKTSGNIRKAADDLAQGLAKVEKLANFDRLERYVDLLERAASAMTALAELEKTGRLDKIAGALK